LSKPFSFSRSTSIKIINVTEPAILRFWGK